MLAPRRALDDLKGDAQAKCEEFFELFSAEQPAPSDATVLAIGAQMDATYHRTRLGGLFALSDGDAEACIAVAAPHDNARGWRLAIEYEAGFKFASGSKRKATSCRHIDDLGRPHTCWRDSQ
jgi:hypothetical protein